MQDLGQFSDDLIRLGAETSKHMDLTADGLEIFDGETSMAEFTADKSRIGEEAAGHVTTTTSQVQVWDGASDTAVATMGTGAIADVHAVDVDGIYIPNGQVAATSVYTWAEAVDYIQPLNIIHNQGGPFNLRAGSIDFNEYGSGEVIALAGVVSIGVADSGLYIGLDNERIGTLARSGSMIIPWDTGEVITPTITAASGTNISSINLVTYGKVAQLVVTFSRTSAQAANAQITVGTLSQTAYRPRAGASGGNQNQQCFINTGGVIYARNNTGASIAANTANTIGFTYILP